MEAIKITNLTRNFKEIVAVYGLTLSVHQGEIFGLVGPDGAGKTTTMRMLAAIMEPTSGDAWVMGMHTVREAEAIKEEIGYMSQRFGLYPDLTVDENIRFYADIYGVQRKGRREKIDSLLSFSRLLPFRKRLAGNLSGGMKQKLGLACALVHTPKVLLLDEPTNGVDPLSRRDFWAILYHLLRERVTIFISTSYLDEAERCNRLALMHKGKVLACGTPDEIKGLTPLNLFEIRTEEPRHAAGVLREKFKEDSFTLFGDRLHLSTKAPGGIEERVKEALAGAGIPLYQIRPVEPSLEDVFNFVVIERHGSADIRHCL